LNFTLYKEGLAVRSALLCIIQFFLFLFLIPSSLICAISQKSVNNCNFILLSLRFNVPLQTIWVITPFSILNGKELDNEKETI